MAITGFTEDHSYSYKENYFEEIFAEKQEHFEIDKIVFNNMQSIFDKHLKKIMDDKLAFNFEKLYSMLARKTKYSQKQIRFTLQRNHETFWCLIELAHIVYDKKYLSKNKSEKRRSKS